MRVLKGFTELFLLTVMLIGWGMGDAMAGGGFTGGGGGGGGFTGRPLIKIEITADKTTLPINLIGANFNINGPYWSTFYVKVTQDGNMFPAESVSVTVASGLNTGDLYYLDGKAEHEKCPTGATCPPTAAVPIAYRSMVFEKTTGISSGHFLAGYTPGTAVLTATATDPTTKQTVSANLTITVTGGGGGIAGGTPAAVNFVMDSRPVYISTNPLGTTPTIQSSIKLFQVFVRDDFGQPVTPPSDVNIHTLRVELLPNRPNGGEWLSTTDAAGRPQEGASVLANMVGGAATLALHAGTLPGTVLISATADRADNNVDNGIQMGITNYAMVPIGTGVINSLTFTGSFADAVLVTANNLIAVNAPCTPPAPEGCVWDGVYSRPISVIASDPFGNPPPAGTPITFRLIDSPLDMLQNRYPDQGHGQFAITGYNGDPQEGGLAFFAPNRTVRRVAGDTLNPFVVPNGVSWAIADPLCLLVLQDPEIINPNPDTINALPPEGRLEYHVGGRIITGRQGNMLTVNETFNQVSQNVGANVWYTVGCPPHKGNVANFYNPINAPTTDVNVMTDAAGVASTIMNYPANQVGRRFMLTAESNGGKVGAAMTHWYLGNGVGAILILTSPAQLAGLFPCSIFDTYAACWNAWPVVPVVQVVPAGTAINLPITFQVLDGGVTSNNILVRTPVPGVLIAVEPPVITNPAAAAAATAAVQLAQATAALAAFDAANPGVCDDVVNPADPTKVVKRDQGKCDQRTALVAILDAATTEAARASALANQYRPTASVVPATFASGAGGYAHATLMVNDLPPPVGGAVPVLGGSVDFYFSTIGPEVSSQAIKITVTTNPVAP
jgi:hypothetical protein